jgi:hypothetical protein
MSSSIYVAISGVQASYQVVEGDWGAAIASRRISGLVTWQEEIHIKIETHRGLLS